MLCAVFFGALGTARRWEGGGDGDECVEWLSGLAVGEDLRFLLGYRDEAESDTCGDAEGNGLVTGGVMYAPLMSAFLRDIAWSTCTAWGFWKSGWLSLSPSCPNGTSSAVIGLDKSNGFTAGLSVRVLGGAEQRSGSNDPVFKKSVFSSSQFIQSLPGGKWYELVNTGEVGESGEAAESPLKSA